MITIPVTRRDVRDAILLCQILATHEDAQLWCNGRVPEIYGTASCGHTDPWNCVAAAIGASPEAAALFIRASLTVGDVWAGIIDDSDLVIVAPRYVAELFSPDLEAECLLREGWLPRGFVLIQ